MDLNTRRKTDGCPTQAFGLSGIVDSLSGVTDNSEKRGEGGPHCDTRQPGVLPWYAAMPDRQVTSK